jgi:hypothetical protein
MLHNLINWKLIDYVIKPTPFQKLRFEVGVAAADDRGDAGKKYDSHQPQSHPEPNL